MRQKERILELVRACFEDIKYVCPVEPAEYSIDIMVDVARGRAYIIELNPFGRPDGCGTGTVMFDNKSADDLAVLFGEAPFQYKARAYSSLIRPCNPHTNLHIIREYGSQTAEKSRGQGFSHMVTDVTTFWLAVVPLGLPTGW